MTKKLGDQKIFISTFVKFFDGFESGMSLCRIHVKTGLHHYMLNKVILPFLIKKGCVKCQERNGRVKGFYFKTEKYEVFENAIKFFT